MTSIICIVPEIQSSRVPHMWLWVRLGQEERRAPRAPFDHTKYTVEVDYFDVPISPLILGPTSQ